MVITLFIRSLIFGVFVTVYRLSTLSKKRNATNLAVFIFSIFSIAQKVLGGLFIRHVADWL